jgi:CTP:molybdopterin cytidylyltransferase MocA
MGRPKALVSLEGRTLLEHILSSTIVRQCGGVWVVLGHHADEIHPIAKRFGARCVVNPDPDRGRMSSIQIGLAALDASIDAAFIQPVDCPLVRPSVYTALSQHLEDHDAATPTREGRGGHPPLIARSLFGSIGTADGDAPLRDIFRAPGVDRVRVPVDDPGVLLNVNRPEDLLDLQRRREARRAQTPLD